MCMHIGCVLQPVCQGRMERAVYKTVVVRQRTKCLHVIIQMGPATVSLVSLDLIAKAVS